MEDQIRRGERYAAREEARFNRQMERVEGRLSKYEASASLLDERLGQFSSYPSLHQGGGVSLDEEADKLVRQYSDLHRLERSHPVVSPSRPSMSGGSQLSDLEKRFNRLKYDRDTPPTMTELEERFNLLKYGQKTPPTTSLSELEKRYEQVFGHPPLSAKNPLKAPIPAPIPAPKAPLRPSLSQPVLKTSAAPTAPTCFPKDQPSATNAIDDDPILKKWRSSPHFYDQLSPAGKIEFVKILVSGTALRSKQVNSCFVLKHKVLSVGKREVLARIDERRKSLEKVIAFYTRISDLISHKRTLVRPELNPVESLRSHVADALSVRGKALDLHDLRSRQLHINQSGRGLERLRSGEGLFKGGDHHLGSGSHSTHF